MDEDPLSALGLRPMHLADRTALAPFFQSIVSPLSDYTFANTVIWAESNNLHWAVLRGCLCVFANGAGDLTLLLPPLGEGDAESALDDAVELCRSYNAAAGVPDATRVEYVSEPWVNAHRIGAGWRVAAMSGDYLYPTARMIALDGPDLAAKRQSRNRFARRYAARSEAFDPSAHRDACLALLDCWDGQVRQAAVQVGPSSHLKRDKEVAACRVAVEHAAELGLTGMVLWAGEQLAGFTFGEPLGDDSFNVLIEKTDRCFAGAAQYIFSEFCRLYWPGRPWCNVGDDWGIENLARVKESYSPARRLAKFVLYPPPVRSGETAAEPMAAAERMAASPGLLVAAV